MTIDTEFDRICEQTKSGKLLWELVPEQDCAYRLTASGQQSCVVSCCAPGFEIRIEGIVLNVPKEKIMRLCSEIIVQINEIKMRRNVELLQTIQPPCALC